MFIVCVENIDIIITYLLLHNKYTVRGVHCTVYTVRRTLYGVHCTAYTVRRTLYAMMDIMRYAMDVQVDND